MQKYYAVLVNSDTNEVREHAKVLCVCAGYSTARRAAKGMNTQGCDGTILEIHLNDTIKIGGWHFLLGPINVLSSTNEDIHNDKLRELEIEKEDKRKLVLEKAKQLGMTEDELKIIRGLY